MSNEADLDWLARNVHVWPTNTPKAILPGDATFKLGAVFYGDCVAFSGDLGPEYRRVNKADWLARRAELQNKPSWEGAPEWAELLAQDDSGEWYWYASKTAHQGMKSWCPAPGANNVQCGKGEVLGDWRDTMERRPADLSEPAVTERLTEATHTVLAAAPALMDEKFRFDRDDWHERGELPPVGVECDIRHSCWNSEKYEKVTVAAITNEYLIVKYATFEQHYMIKDISFRPIRTERDVLLSIIVEEMNRYDTDGKLADAILAAGFSLRDK